MSVSEDERTEFHDRNETGEIHDFYDWIATVEGGVLSLDWYISVQKRFLSTVTGFSEILVWLPFSVFTMTQILPA